MVEGTVYKWIRLLWKLVAVVEGGGGRIGRDMLLLLLLLLLLVGGEIWRTWPVIGIVCHIR